MTKLKLYLALTIFLSCTFILFSGYYLTTNFSKLNFVTLVLVILATLFSGLIFIFHNLALDGQKWTYKVLYIIYNIVTSIPGMGFLYVDFNDAKIKAYFGISPQQKPLTEKLPSAILLIIIMMVILSVGGMLWLFFSNGPFTGFHTVPSFN